MYAAIDAYAYIDGEYTCVTNLRFIILIGVTTKPACPHVVYEQELSMIAGMVLYTCT